jgi:protease I
MRIACLLGQEFEDSEFRVPYDRFRRAGHEVVVIGLKAGETVVGKEGKEHVRIDEGIGASRADDFDALFIPGGHSPDVLRGDERMIDFVRRFRERPILAICHGAQLLITADLVRGRKMTAWKTVQLDLRNAGAEVRDEPVVVDGNLVTGRRPEDLEAFVRESLRLLEGATGAHAQP